MRIKTLNRVIAHKVNKKTLEMPAYADFTSDLLDYSDEDKAILIERIEKAINNQAKTFELSFNNYEDKSVFHLLNNESYRESEGDFVELSQNLAEKLAEAQTSIKIPSGYCIIGDGVTIDNDYFFYIIKADNQEVFNIVEKQLKIIRNVFLSPAKDFYKVGFFLKEKNIFKPYMYDDLFSLQKKDLTAYFYDRFLGLSTDQNDKLRTKNFYYDIKAFIEKNVNEAADSKGLQRALQVYIRENPNGIISAREFSDMYLEGWDVQRLFDIQIVELKYPRPFTKDVSLLKANNLDIQRVTIGSDITIVTKGDSNTLQVLDNPSMEVLQPYINTGCHTRIVIFQTESGELEDMCS